MQGSFRATYLHENSRIIKIAGRPVGSHPKDARMLLGRRSRTNNMRSIKKDKPGLKQVHLQAKQSAGIGGQD
jgi:hypothetical protein